MDSPDRDDALQGKAGHTRPPGLPKFGRHQSFFDRLLIPSYGRQPIFEPAEVAALGEVCI